MSAESNEPDNRVQTLALPETTSVPQQDSEMTSESNEPDHKSSDSSGVFVAEYKREEIVGDCDPSGIEQNVLTGMTNTGHTTSHSAQQSSEPNKETAKQESSSSQESCEAYFTRRMEELGGEDYDLPIQEVTVLGAKGSCAEPLELYPGLNRATYGDSLNDSLPPDVLLDTEHNYVADPRLRKRRVPPCKPKVVIAPEESTSLQDTRGESSHKSANEEDDEPSNELYHTNLETKCSSSHMGETELGQNSDVISFGAARSTLADALSPTKGPVSGLPDITSGSEAEESVFGGIEKDSGDHQLSNTSRAIINHYFQEASTIELPRGHPTIALNSEQVQSILRVVADESARASYAMMEDIIERARRLSLSNLSNRRTDQRDISEGGSAPTSDAETYTDRETDRAGSFTSGALRTDDDSNSIGYSYERPSPSLVNVAQPPQRREPMQTDLASPEPQQLADSPGAQTLAALNEEARKDQPSKGRKSKTQ